MTYLCLKYIKVMKITYDNTVGIAHRSIRWAMPTLLRGIEVIIQNSEETPTRKVKPG